MTGDLQAIGDRAEIEALRCDYTDAVMTREYDRLASLFTPEGAVRMPHINEEAVGRTQIRRAILVHGPCSPRRGNRTSAVRLVQARGRDEEEPDWLLLIVSAARSRAYGVQGQTEPQVMPRGLKVE